MISKHIRYKGHSQVHFLTNLGDSQERMYRVPGILSLNRRTSGRSAMLYTGTLPPPARIHVHGQSCGKICQADARG